MKVVLENFQFLGDGHGTGGTASSGGSESDKSVPSPEKHSPAPRTGAPKPAAQDNIDEDVPF